MGEVAIVFSDIMRAAALWDFNPEAMRDATIAHNELLRRRLREFGGYEVICFTCVLSVVSWSVRVRWCGGACHSHKATTGRETAAKGPCVLRSATWPRPWPGVPGCSRS
jgi:hypothetical protein